MSGRIGLDGPREFCGFAWFPKIKTHYCGGLQHASFIRNLFVHWKKEEWLLAC
jgi:hypothetical protein